MDRWILFYYVNLRRNNLSNRKEDGEELLLLLLRTRRNGRSFLFLRGCLWIPTLWGVQSICAIVRGEVDPTALLFAAQSVSPSLSVHSRMDPFNLSASINSFHGRRRYQYLSYRNVLLLHHRIIHPSRKGAADPQNSWLLSCPFFGWLFPVKSGGRELHSLDSAYSDCYP